MRILHPRISPFLVAFYLAGLSLHATENKPVQSVKIESIFIESEKPLFDTANLSLSFPNSAIDGMLSMTGVLPKEQMDAILKRLTDSEKSDVLSLPTLFARSNNRAKLMVTQQVRYATEYAPKQEGKPLIPTEFENKDVGVTMEAKPIVAADGYTIDLTINPRIVSLIGYQVPGESPTYFKEKVSLKESCAALPSEFPRDKNVQPIFSNCEVTTHVTLYNGSSVILQSPVKNDLKSDKARYSYLIVSASLIPSNVSK